ncbi:MAG: serine/threonine-protein kinase [Limnobacter sp.]|nr:serine/threonine-protein kinase [Limnobacter sp.]
MSEDDQTFIIRKETKPESNPAVEADLDVSEDTSVDTSADTSANISSDTSADSKATPPALTIHASSGHLPKGTRIEGFEIINLLGMGGFGLVYKAWDPTLEREVALKEYLPESLAYRDAQGLVRLKKEGHKETFDAGMRSFVNEAKLLARFDHPALIKVFRFWESNGTAYMVMPYYKGKTLKARQADIQSPITEHLLLDMILPMCDALHIMHQQHCIHRDVSPDNVIVQEESGNPILLDFGAARRAIGQCGQSFTVILKSGYAPIEQYAEIPHYQQGPWTDVYALAALAHYLIRGKAPSPAVGRMVHDTHQPLAEDVTLPYAKHLLKALDWGLQIEPDKRPQSMHEFRAALVGASLFGTALSGSKSDEDSLLTAFLNESESSSGSSESDATGDEARQSIRLTGKQWMKWMGLVLIPLACLVYVLTAVELTPPAAPEVPSAPIVPDIPDVPSVQVTPQVHAEAAEPNPFELILQSATPGWTVTVDSPLKQLRIDKDLLRLNITSAKDGYLMVWVESAGGAVDVLPLSSKSKPLKVKAGQAIQAPDISEPLLAGGPEGKNRILVLVTENPLDRKTVASLEIATKGLVNYGAGVLEIEQVASAN